MNSPSDDGQYTDSDKEDGAVDNDRKSLESGTSDQLLISGNSSNPSSQRIESENNANEHLSASSSDAESEEARLRQKLLERRNVLNSSSNSKREVIEVEHGTTSSVSVTISNMARNLTPMLSISPKVNKTSKLESGLPASSDDEEMFSVQPKDSAARHRCHSARSHGYKARDRGARSEKIRKSDKVKDDKYRHKERKHEKHVHGDYAKRGYESREVIFVVRKRKIIECHSRKASVLTFRNLFMRKSNKKGIKPSKRRELLISPKRSAVIPGAGLLKRSCFGKHEGNEMDLVTVSVVDGTVNHAVRKKSDEGTIAENIRTAETVNLENIYFFFLVTPMSASRYSKFDSDPEDEKAEDKEAKSPVSKDVVDEIMDNASGTSDGSNLSDCSELLHLLRFSNLGSESDVILRNSDDDSLIDPGFKEDQIATLSPETRFRVEEEWQRRLVAKLPVYYPGISGCRNVAEFECLNRIEEGTFGVVYRAKEKKTDEIVALKRLKMEKEKEGFPITSLREINMLLKAGNHPNIVNVREIVIGSNMDKIYLVMEYVEHDMKSLMDAMHSRGKRFRTGEVKTLLHQLLSGVAHMHDEWILHRDLKTSNLLLSHKGVLKIGDFGLSREFGDPLKPYTPVVVTLWYRAPELLLGVKEYSTAVDIWSCGCIFAEFLKLKPLFPGKGEIDQINKIFVELGTPDDSVWPGFSSLPGPKKTVFDRFEPGELDKKFPANLIDEMGLEFIKQLLMYDPSKRISAHEALRHHWFQHYPHPTPPEMFPTWPAKSELGKSVTKTSIKKPSSSNDVQNAKLYKEFKMGVKKEVSTSFALKFDVAPKFTKKTNIG
ncbi:unnamed protein product [Thelazia callipaeda]|uniref:cyclin-dependent kinase n=1 Tax=Thelazia callipaeda TaxID=103827 RepID=A0A0N5D7D3_THECL|nr:unnamed protein product [Thelazia callipaeda]